MSCVCTWAQLLKRCHQEFPDCLVKVSNGAFFLRTMVTQSWLPRSPACTAVLSSTWWPHGALQRLLQAAKRQQEGPHLSTARSVGVAQGDFHTLPVKFKAWQEAFSTKKPVQNTLGVDKASARGLFLKCARERQSPKKKLFTTSGLRVALGQKYVTEHKL